MLDEKKLSTEKTDGRKDPIADQVQPAAPSEIMSEAMNRALTFDDLAEEPSDLDTSLIAKREAHPFFSYNSRIIKQRVIPRDPRLDFMQMADLIEFCRVRNYIDLNKMSVTTYANPDNKAEKLTKISRCDMKKEELQAWIEKNETLTFPTVSVVFCQYRKNKKVPYSRAIKSFVDNNIHEVIFDKEWVLPNGKKRPGWYAIVQDHTLRAQLVYRFDPKKRGRLIIDNRFKFLKEDNRQLEPLKQVFLVCQMTRTAIREAGIAASGETAEKQLLGDEFTQYTSATP